MKPEQIDALIALVLKAGEEVMRFYDGECATRSKEDGSPVTEADVAAETILLAGLAEIAPEIPALSEEQVEAGSLPDLSGGRFWCIDPIDGTKEFINRTGEFTVCLGYSEDGEATGGLLHSPALGRTFVGLKGWGAIEVLADGSKRPIQVRAPGGDKLALVSRSHHTGRKLDDFLAAEGADQKVVGSALKFGLIAAGEADLTARVGPTCEWDTCAGQAVLEAAGGSVKLLDGSALTYGKPGFRNPGFVARGGL
ncbi:3'(2'),5'-bisphosphate nucleotidase CysQ [Lacibacterium aquatile]|uniref:3'(2'),5'-bisphosphate nucleotidase CysQ n=1 Tax=Lacibacterium aquatile TaxID=1168082 RepID=A0ABW5DRG0_9PROT